MSIRLEVNRKGFKTLARDAKAVLQDKSCMMDTYAVSNYHVEVKMIDDSTVQIVLPVTGGGLAGVRITLTSCDLMDLINKTFNGTMKLISASATLSEALKAMMSQTVKALDDDADQADFAHEDEGDDEENE